MNRKISVRVGALKPNRSLGTNFMIKLISDDLLRCDRGCGEAIFTLTAKVNELVTEVNELTRNNIRLLRWQELKERPQRGDGEGYPVEGNSF